MTKEFDVDKSSDKFVPMAKDKEEKSKEKGKCKGKKSIHGSILETEEDDCQKSSEEKLNSSSDIEHLANISTPPLTQSVLYPESAESTPVQQPENEAVQGLSALIDQLPQEFVYEARQQLSKSKKNRPRSHTI